MPRGAGAERIGHAGPHTVADFARLSMAYAREHGVLGHLLQGPSCWPRLAPPLGSKRRPGQPARWVPTLRIGQHRAQTRRDRSQGVNFQPLLTHAAAEFVGTTGWRARFRG